MGNLDIVYIAGTGEPMPANGGRPLGTLSGVANELDRLAPGKFKHRTILYPAQYAGPGSYGDSRAQAELMAHQLLDRIGGGRVVGYSMGAAAAGNVTDRRDDVPCGYLLADPLRPSGANRTGYPGQSWRRYDLTPERFVGWGVSGQRKVGVARWYSLPDDIITDAYADSLVRDFADLSEYFGVAQLDDPKQWISDVLGKIKRDAWQNLPFWEKLLRSPDRLESVIQIGTVASRTLNQGVRYPGWHCSYGTEIYPGTGRTYIKQLAWDIARDAGEV